MEEKDHPINEDLIIRYLQGKLDDADLCKQVEDWLALNDNQKTARDTYKAWELSMLAAPHKKDTQKAFNNLVQKIEDSQKPSKQVNMWWYAAAASIVLVLCMVFLFNPTKSTQDTTLTSVEKIMTVPMEDGSQVSLDNGASITYNKESILLGNERKVHLSGQAFFVVSHQPERPFIVTTQDAKIKVLGTKFMVKTFDDAPTKVLVTEGKVSVTYLQTHKELILEAEQETISEESDKNEPKVKPSDDNQLYWKTGVMSFSNVSLNDVLKTLSEEFEVQILTENEQILSCMITATFKRQSLETILEVIKSTHQLESTTDGNTIVLSGNGCN